MSTSLASLRDCHRAAARAPALFAHSLPTSRQRSDAHYRGPATCKTSSGSMRAAEDAVLARLSALGSGGHHTEAAERALRPIQPQPVALDNYGLVPNHVSLAAVPSVLQLLLGAAVAAYQEEASPGTLVGVYLRGSLVQEGCFLAGVSDADFLALYHEPAAEPADARGEAEQEQGGTVGLVVDASSRPALQRSRLQQAAEQLQRDFPQCTKVELKVVTLLPGSALDRLAGAAMGSEAPMQIPPSAVLEQPALAFMLKTQAVCLYGWDLPSLLPDVAALPPLQLLPSLVDDVAAAQQHAQQQLQPAAAGGADEGSRADGSVSGAARAVRWALKRCIRAAFELRLCVSGSSGGPDQQLGVYTRDLYWCLHYAGQRYPGLRQPLEAALWLYLELGTAAAAASQRAVVAQQLEQQALIEEGAALAGQLAAQIDRLFLQAMLSEEPGWLSYHGSAGQCQDGNSPTAGQPSQMAADSWEGRSEPQSRGRGMAGRGKGGIGGRLGAWWTRLRVALWAGAATAVGPSSRSVSSGGDGGGPDRASPLALEDDLVGFPPPPVAATVTSSILTLDWSDPAARQQAAALISAATSCGAAAAAAAALGAVPEPGTGPGCSSEGALRPQPVLLKGAVAHWAAVRRWSLGALAAAGLEGRVRVAPSLQFPFVEPRLAATLAAEKGVAALPSCVARMSTAEFAARLQRRNPCRLGPLAYGNRHTVREAVGGDATRAWGASSAGASAYPEEYYYLQAELPESLLQEIDLSAPPFAPPPGSGQPAAPLLRQTQAARVWAGPQGAVSPTHYDLSHSFLSQVKGRKRMLFWSPDQLQCLYFYPDTHLLRRRSRVNMHQVGPDLSRFPLLARATATEAVLEPGDVVFFPSRWAHYTESLDFSISVTARYGAAS